MSKSNEHHFLEAGLENIEALTDLYIDNEAISSIPIIGTVIKICKGLDDIRSRSFAAKIAAFITEPGLQKSNIKEKLKQQAKSDEDAQNVGETLFFVLEKMTDLEKPKVLEKIFVAYLDGVVSKDELRRLAQAVDLAFIDDLNDLLKYRSSDTYRLQGTWPEPLLPSGLTATYVISMSGSAKQEYKLTNLGSSFKRAINHSKTYSS
jgi:hypothetical protein